MEVRFAKRGYRRVGERRITAWDIKSRVDDLKKKRTLLTVLAARAPG